jgi:hypothetical protein
LSLDRRTFCVSAAAMGAHSAVAAGATHASGAARSSCSAQGAAVLCAWFDVDPANRSDFYDWHTREHFPERLSVPGFLRGRRFIGVRAEAQFFIAYDVESLATLSSAAYLSRLNHPTDWTKRTVALMTNQRRIATRVLLRKRIGSGGFILTMRVKANSGLVTADLEHALSAMLGEKGIVSVALCETDGGTSLISTTESRQGHHDYVPTDEVLLVEGITCEHLEALTEAKLGAAALKNLGLEWQSAAAIFHLQVSVDRRE